MGPIVPSRRPPRPRRRRPRAGLARRSVARGACPLPTVLHPYLAGVPTLRSRPRHRRCRSRARRAALPRTRRSRPPRSRGPAAPAGCRRRGSSGRSRPPRAPPVRGTKAGSLRAPPASASAGWGGASGSAAGCGSAWAAASASPLGSSTAPAPRAACPPRRIPPTGPGRGPAPPGARTRNGRRSGCPAGTTAATVPIRQEGNRAGEEEDRRLALDDGACSRKLHHGGLREKPRTGVEHGDPLTGAPHALRRRLNRNQYRLRARACLVHARGEGSGVPVPHAAAVGLVRAHPRREAVRRDDGGAARVRQRHPRANRGRRTRTPGCLR